MLRLASHYYICQLSCSIGWHSSSFLFHWWGTYSLLVFLWSPHLPGRSYEQISYYHHLPTKKRKPGRTTFKTICVACNMSLISLISSVSLKLLLLFNLIGAVYILFALCAHMTAHWWQAAQNVFVCLSVQYSLIFQISTSSMNVLITSFPLHMLACHFKGEVAESIQWDYSFACLLWG